jgi:hypothetical protein
MKMEDVGSNKQEHAINWVRDDEIVSPSRVLRRLILSIVGFNNLLRASPHLSWSLSDGN